MNKNDSVEKITTQDSQTNQSNYEHYEFTPEYNFPDDFVYQIQLLEEGDEDCEYDSLEDIAKDAIEEAGYIVTDWQNCDFYAEDFPEGYEALRSYLDVIEQCVGEEGIPDWLWDSYVELAQEYSEYIS